VVAGVLPGLSVTGRGAHSHLQRAAGRGSGARMGRVWTVIVVAQVALTVMFVPVAVLLGLQTWEMRTAEPVLPAGEVLTAWLEPDEDLPSGSPAGAPRADGAMVRFQAEYRALERRLDAEAGVRGVTFAERMPGMPHPRPKVEVDAPGLPARPAGEGAAQLAFVDADFFEVMGATIVSGRALVASDAGQPVVVVNESFARELLGGRSAVGRRLRYKSPADGDKPAPWREIVGVVRDLAMTVDPTLPHNAGAYHPLPADGAYPLQMGVRVEGDPAAFRGRLLEIAAEAAPALRIRRPAPIEHAARGMTITLDAWFRVVVLAGAMVLLLTNAGIYAVISFTVARRTREIGVRVALGADRRRVVSAILSRTARHVGTGVLVGAVLALLMTFAASQGSWRPPILRGGALLVAYMAAMMGVCMLACVVPTRRALRIEPMEALNADG
jgi:putative ABC transport system permease protein